MNRICKIAIITLITVGVQAQTTTTPPPDLIQTHPATVAQIKEYFAVTHALDTAHALMRQMVGSMQATAAPYIPKSVWDDMRTSFDSVDLEAAMIPAYQKYFSEEDMQQVINFYKSPAGQHMISAQPLIVSASGDQLRKTGEELGRQVAMRHADEIVAAKKKYDEEIISKQNSSKKQD